MIKVDASTKSYISWQEKNCFAGEPIFVAAPNAKVSNNFDTFIIICINLKFQEEDDGVLISSLVWGQDENHVTLIILNAKTMEEMGRCDFYTNSPVPRCFHGWFLAESS